MGGEVAGRGTPGRRAEDVRGLDELYPAAARGRPEADATGHRRPPGTGPGRAAIGRFDGRPPDAARDPPRRRSELPAGMARPAPNMPSKTRFPSRFDTPRKGKPAERRGRKATGLPRGGGDRGPTRIPSPKGEGSGLRARGRRPLATTAGLPNGWSIPYRPTHRGRVLRAAGPVPVPRHGGSGRRDRLGSRPPAAAGGFHLVPLMDPGSLPRFAPGSLPAAGAHRSRIAGPMCPRGSRAAVARRSLEGDGPCCEDSTPPPAA